MGAPQDPACGVATFKGVSDSACNWVLRNFSSKNSKDDAVEGVAEGFKIKILVVKKTACIVDQILYNVYKLIICNFSWLCLIPRKMVCMLRFSR